MGRLVKCQYCQQMVDKDVSVRFEDKNFHEKCCQDYKDRKKIYKYRKPLIPVLAGSNGL